MFAAVRSINETISILLIALGFNEEGNFNMTNDQIVHGQRIAARRAINGQPNGYKPVSEAELQALKQSLADTLDPNFGKVAINAMLNKAA